MVETLGTATNTGEEVVRIEGEDGSTLFAFVGEEEVELVIKNEANMKMTRKAWNSFAGKSLKMAHTSLMPIV